MVQLFDSTGSYPSTSIVAYHGGLYQTLSFSSPTSAPLSSPWVYLGTDTSGIPTPQSQLLSSTTQTTGSIFDEAEELSMAAEEAFNSFEDDSSADGEWRHISSPTTPKKTAARPTQAPARVITPPSSSAYTPPTSAHDHGSQADRECALQASSHVLKAELAGEFVFKASARGCFAFSGASGDSHSEDAQLEQLREESFRDILGDDRKGGEDAEKRETWMDGAKARKEYYGLPGAEGPDVQWILVSPSQPFPPNALPIGSESTSDPSHKPLYACRAYADCSVQIGKAGPHLGSPRHSYASSAGSRRELFFHQNTFEVLCTSDSPSVSPPTRWVTVPSHAMGEEVKDLLRGERPVEGGRERDGSWIGVGRAVIKGGEHPGKVSFGSNQIRIGWGGKEHLVNGYQLLVYA